MGWTGGGNFGGLQGRNLSFEGGENSEREKPSIGRTTTNKISKDVPIIKTPFGDLLQVSKYEGKVTGEEGEWLTIDGATNNRELEGGSITIGGALVLGYGTDGPVSGGLSVAGYQFQTSYGLGVGLGQVGFDVSHTYEKGAISGYSVTVRPGYGPYVLDGAAAVLALFTPVVAF